MTIDAAATALDEEIERILRGETVPTDEPAAEGELAALIATARALHAALPRFHPRFGFEEALAVRLIRGDAGDPAAPIPFPAELADGRAGDARRVWARYRRELVAGGAIASGVSIALPLAGAALVRWRRSRSSSGTGGIF